MAGIPRYFTKYKPTKLEELKDEDGQLAIPDEIGQVHACLLDMYVKYMYSIYSRYMYFLTNNKKTILTFLFNFFRSNGTELSRRL